MVKARLGSRCGVKVHLDSEPCYEPVQVLPTLTLKQRERIGFTDDGDPLIRWVTVVIGLAVLWEMRTETDDIAGTTSIAGRAVMLYDGDTDVTESAMVYASTGGRFGVTRVEQLPDHLKLELVRNDG